MISRTVKALLFDAGDTLIAYRRPMRVLLQDFFIERDTIVRQDVIADALEETEPRYRTLVGQTRTIEAEHRMWIELARDFLDVVLPRRRDLYLDLAHWFTDGWKHMKVFRDVRPTLRALVERGYTLGVVSNWEPSLTTTLAHLGLDRHFQAIIISAVEGIWKPDPRLFQVALDRLEVSPEAALSVGDHLARDVEAANAAGIRGVLLDRFNDHREFNPRITDLTALLSFLPEAASH
jgi:putative hydrolase of the HAD superfamily